MFHSVITAQFLLIVAMAVSCQETPAGDKRHPVYKYRYETEDLMKTAASSVPVHGYHLVEGGYYPEARFGNFGPIGPQSSGGYGPGPGFGLRTQVPQQLHTVPIGLHQGLQQQPFGGLGGGVAGGQFQDHTVYQDGKQQQNDASFKKAQATEEASGKQDQSGFQRGEAQVRNDKGDSQSYSGAQGQQKAVEDGANYHGSQRYDQQGKNGGEENQKQGHKKGHVIKGFKTSHHKDETGRTEEYYDESNDEGGHHNFKGASGSYGEEAKKAYKGGHENGQFNADQSKKQGHAENVHVLDNANADKGGYANQKAYGQGNTFGVNNGVDQHSLLGHQESSRFFKHHPYHVPFYNKGY